MVTQVLAHFINLWDIFGPCSNLQVANLLTKKVQYCQFCDINFNSQEKEKTGKEKTKKAVLNKIYFSSRKVEEEEWPENFRMSSEALKELCWELYPRIFNSYTRLQKAAAVKSEIDQIPLFI